MKYGLHVLVSIGETTDERSIEIQDEGELTKKVEEAMRLWPNFKAITIVHIEDLMNLMQDAIRLD